MVKKSEAELEAEARKGEKGGEIQAGGGGIQAGEGESTPTMGESTEEQTEEERVQQEMEEEKRAEEGTGSASGRRGVWSWLTGEFPECISEWQKRGVVVADWCVSGMCAQRFLNVP
jgi:hypothetical protein